MGSCDIVLEMQHPSYGGGIMTDRTATRWAHARALYEAIWDE
jgi:ribosomal protein S9